MEDSVLRRLDASEEVALEQGLALGRQLANSESVLRVDEVQQLYDAAVGRAERDPETLIAIGLSFGALIVDAAEFEWARIVDQWGSETCVGVVGKVSHCAPISMIQKRVGRAEAVNIAEMRDGTVKVLREQADSAMDR